MRRQVELIVPAAAQFARRDWPRIVSLPFPLLLAYAVDSRMRELKLTPTPLAVWAPRPPMRISIAEPARIVGRGSVALPRMGVAGQGAVEDRRRGLAVLNDGQIVVLVLVWLFAFVLPLLGPELPPRLHAVLSDSYATFALALAITWRILDKKG